MTSVTVSTSEEFLLANLEQINAIALGVYRRSGMTPDLAEDFASSVRIRLIENDYALLRRFNAGKGSLESFITTIVKSMIAAESRRTYGKWRPSTAAERWGPIALELEKLLYREGHDLSHTLEMLLAKHPTVTRQELQAIAQQLPPRMGRRQSISLDAVAHSLSDDTDADALVIASERRHLSQRVATIVRQRLERLESADRLLLQLLYGTGTNLQTIARILGSDATRLYPRRDALLRDLRERLLEAGIGATEALDLIGHMSDADDFGLRRSEQPMRESGNKHLAQR
jgi:RNA polymerase sigma factor (sigma-70 family)